MPTCFAFFDFGTFPQLFLTEMSPVLLVEKNMHLQSTAAML